MSNRLRDATERVLEYYYAEWNVSGDVPVELMDELKAAFDEEHGPDWPVCDHGVKDGYVCEKCNEDLAEWQRTHPEQTP